MMYLRATNNRLSYWIGTKTGGNFLENNTTSVSTWKANGGGSPGTPGWNFYVLRFNGSDQTSIFLDGVLLNTETSSRSMNNQNTCLLYTSPSPRDRQKSRMPSSA